MPMLGERQEESGLPVIRKSKVKAVKIRGGRRGLYVCNAGTLLSLEARMLRQCQSPWYASDRHMQSKASIGAASDTLKALLLTRPAQPAYEQRGAQQLSFPQLEPQASTRPSERSPPGQPRAQPFARRCAIIYEHHACQRRLVQPLHLSGLALTCPTSLRNSQ